MLLLLSTDLFSSNLYQNILSGLRIISVSNGLDPEQDRRSVGPDLGPNCLQRLLDDDKSHP